MSDLSKPAGILPEERGVAGQLDLRQTTVDTYNRSAKALADYFQGIGPRTQDIKTALKLANASREAKVFEIGCGDGRDAAEILKLVRWYEGIDISSAMIDLASQKVPGAKFVVADVVEYNFPRDTDVIFAFASLLHLDKQAVKEVLDKCHDSLRSGGVVFLSLKYSAEYHQEVKNDRFGSREFYFYNQAMISDLAGEKFKTTDFSRGFKTGADTVWIEMALVKP